MYADGCGLCLSWCDVITLKGPACILCPCSHALAPSCTLLSQMLEDGLDRAHVPYAYGFAIILLTVLVKAATYPLSRKSVSACPAPATWGAAAGGAAVACRQPRRQRRSQAELTTAR
jgi:hypothetical protein